MKKKVAEMTSAEFAAREKRLAEAAWKKFHARMGKREDLRSEVVTEMVPLSRAVKGDPVAFLYQGQAITGKVVRVKKDDNIVTVEILNEDGEEQWVDIRR